MIFWLVEIPILCLMGACWGISRVEGEVIGAASLAPFLIPVFIGLVAFFGGELLDALLRADNESE